ncbi:MAG TPA: tetratricopeptide repeat protein [Tepidisphaeraceae bacterium]|jgi:hypothetical protein
MRNPRVIAAIVFLSVLAVFGRLCTSEFTWYDDSETVHHNPLLNPPTAAGIGSYWTRISSSAPLGLYIPLTYTVWGALAKVAYIERSDDPMGIHLNPWVFHSANVLLHATSAVLVFLILRLLIKKEWPAAAGAMLFALHPVQAEAVAWVSGMKDVLCGMLSLLAVWQYLLRTRTNYIIAMIALVAAMLAKPTAMVVPLIALCIDVLVLQRSWRATMSALLPWFVLVIPCILWTRAAQGTAGVPVAPLWARPIIALDSLGFYLAKMIWPTSLAVVYGRTPLRVFESNAFWFTWIAPAGLFVVLLLNRRRFPELLAAALLVVIGVLPVLGLAPFQFQYFSGVADHYLYLAMLGPALAAAVILHQMPGRLSASIAIVVLIAVSVLSFRQAGFWHDEMRLWQHNLAAVPDSALSHTNYGVVLYRSGQIPQAEEQFDEAIRIDPNDGTAHNKLAVILASSGRGDEAIAHIGAVIRINQQMPPVFRPAMDQTRNLFGMLLMSRGQFDQAAEQFRAALAENPQLESARENLKSAEERMRPGDKGAR